MNSGAYYESGPSTFTYITYNTTSGWYLEYSNGPGKGAIGGDYNNPIAASLKTGSWPKITKSHAETLKRSLDNLRTGKLDLIGRVAVVDA